MTINLEKIKFKQEEIDRKLKGSDRLRFLRNFIIHLEYQQYMEPGQAVVCGCIKAGHNRKIGDLAKNNARAIQNG